MSGGLLNWRIRTANGLARWYRSAFAGSGAPPWPC
jgi:hypothetical protein